MASQEYLRLCSFRKRGVQSFALIVCAAVLFALSGMAGGANAEPARYKDRCLKDLVSQVPQILASQDSKTGRFGTGIWVVIDQNVLLPLATAWSYKDPRNPYYHSPQVLTAIVKGGDALIEAQDAKGEWVFNKKDGSVWGMIYQPWTYSRWVRAFQMIRGAMPSSERARWEKALLLGYNGISVQERTATLHNIPAHHAMGLYFACKVFSRPEWCVQAANFLHREAAAQYSDGYWSEHSGPVVLYDTVYVDALGTYLAVSKDESVRPVLRKAAVFHAHFTYPDGTDAETIDERNPYLGKVRVPNVGFTFSPEGRAYLMRQIQLLHGPIPADDAASLLLWGQEGEAVDCAQGDSDYTLPSGEATVRRRGPWFLVASAFTAPVIQRRWIQDRQNFVSVYHDETGLIVGGGNTKLQPRWSNFTVGNMSLLRLKPGDENPNFIPPPGIQHVPDAAHLVHNGNTLGVELIYGSHHGRIALTIVNRNRLEYTIAGDPAMAAHFTILPHMGKQISTAAGQRTALSAAAFDWHPGAWIEHAGVRYLLPAGAVARWPVLPHDPYKKDGHADADQGRIVIDLAKASESIGIEIEK
ncbi:MAG TPA: hypothetical protein VKV15_14950 [Bryobacteraceae bacterium]|nr:hypothetical protein [Bryobacteraceae bacterium]